MYVACNYLTYTVLSGIPLYGAGIASSNLEVLETHVVHSLSKEKSAAQFFMMQYSQSFDIKHSVSLKELVERSVLFANFLS